MKIPCYFLATVYIIMIMLTACTVQEEIKFVPWNQGLPKSGEWRTNVAVGDVNNDGLLDVAGISRKGDGNMSIWLNLGNSSWQRNVEGILQEMECGGWADFKDVNKDSNLDVVFGRHCGGVLACLGNGKGNWNCSSEGFLPDGVNTVALSDFDNDGWLDIVTMDAFTEGFEVYKGGKGWQRVQDTGLPTRFRASPTDLKLADINNDGLVDIIGGAGEVLIYKNIGNFKFEQFQTIPGWYVSVKDMTDDGKEDIIITGQNISFYKNAAKDFEKIWSIEKRCAGVDAGKINQNQVFDIATICDDGIYILYDFNPALTKIGEALGGTPRGLTLADFNNDRRLDLACSSGIESQPGQIQVLIQD